MENKMKIKTILNNLQFRKIFKTRKKRLKIKICSIILAKGIINKNKKENLIIILTIQNIKMKIKNK